MNAIQNELTRAWKVHQQKQFVEAESIYRRVLKQAPQDPNAWCYLGIVLHDQRHYDQAVQAYRTALGLQSHFPIALNNLGNSLRYVGDYDEADACFQRAIDLKPDYLNAYKNRGTLHVWTGSLELGLKYYEQALAINPNEAELHRNLGVIYLLQGRFELGWREYRWRWKVGDLNRPFNSIPVWDGSDLRGKSILLTAEQGLGDTLNFVRFARTLKDLGATTLVYCQPPLLTLLQNSPELGPVFPNSLALEQRVDLQCSLLDVADLRQTDASNIPGQFPYIRPAPNLESYWSRRLVRTDPALRVGIAWQGNPDHQADVFRSVPLSCFEPLASVPGADWFCLQSGHGIEQLQDWRGAAPIQRMDPNLDRSSGAFMDTAAIMKTLDLVITSDTSIAHLAGAMAVPTWIALGYVPDWRWLLGRSDSPWYPTVKLFRQPQMGDWPAVFEQMRVELGEWCRQRQAKESNP